MVRVAVRVTVMVTVTVRIWVRGLYLVLGLGFGSVILRMLVGAEPSCRTEGSSAGVGKGWGAIRALALAWK